jgi:hypothetical protein
LLLLEEEQVVEAAQEEVPLAAARWNAGFSKVRFPRTTAMWSTARKRCASIPWKREPMGTNPRFF